MYFLLEIIKTNRQTNDMKTGERKVISYVDL